MGSDWLDEPLVVSLPSLGDHLASPFSWPVNGGHHSSYFTGRLWGLEKLTSKNDEWHTASTGPPLPLGSCTFSCLSVALPRVTLTCSLRCRSVVLLLWSVFPTSLAWVPSSLNFQLPGSDFCSDPHSIAMISFLVHVDCETGPFILLSFLIFRESEGDTG